jgi:hypothetical protein
MLLANKLYKLFGCSNKFKLRTRRTLQSLHSGVITDKNVLPITRLNFGRTQLETSSGIHTLGQFECTGTEALTRMPTSCQDLWLIGHTLNGFFSVMGSKTMESVYCDFTKIPGDEGKYLIEISLLFNLN